jgi:putative ABC transport system ATP-binding protein
MRLGRKRSTLNALPPNADGHRPAVRLVTAVKEYGVKDTRVRALDGVDLTVSPGTWTAVMGPSGSGKSTLLHCMAGLERLDGGRVVLDGDDITRAPESALTALRRAGIGFVFQSFNLIGSLTAEQNVALPLRLAGATPSRRNVHATLAAVGLGDRMGHRPSQLSGGQQQRVAIARAMITRPAVLFADEPTGALDTSTARTVLGLLREMVRAGQTIVMVTHDPVAASQADEVVFLRDGRVVDRCGTSSAHAIADRLTRLED